MYKAGNRVANYGQWVSRRQPESGPVNDPWGRRHDDAIDNPAGQEVYPPPGVRFSVPANQVSSPKPKSPALYDGKSSCRDYLVQFEMVSDLNR